MSRFDAASLPIEMFLYETHMPQQPISRIDLLSLHAQLGNRFLLLLNNMNVVAFYPFFTEDAEQYLKELEALGKINPRTLTTSTRLFYPAQLEYYLHLKRFTEQESRDVVEILLERPINMHLSTKCAGMTPAQETLCRDLTETEFRGAYLYNLMRNDSVSKVLRAEIVARAKEKDIPLIALENLVATA